MRIEFKVIGTPKPQARPRFFRNKAGYMGTFSPKTDWFNLVYHEALKVKQDRLKENKLEGALKVKLWFAMPIPKSATKKQRSSMFYLTKKPDIDNLAKAILDAINYTNLWQDDSQIAVLETTKIYSESPHCHITIEQI